MSCLIFLCVDVELFQTVEEAAKMGAAMAKASTKPKPTMTDAVLNAVTEILSMSVNCDKQKKREFNDTQAPKSTIARKQAIYEVTDVVGVHIYSGGPGYLIVLVLDDYMKRNTCPIHGMVKERPEQKESIRQHQRNRF